MLHRWFVIYVFPLFFHNIIEFPPIIIIFVCAVRSAGHIQCSPINIIRERITNIWRCCSQTVYWGQTTTAIESSITNARHTVANGYRSQSTTIDESVLTNTCHTVGNSNWRQATTASESILTNTCHTVANGYRSQSTTVTVFASLLLSIIYILNGRKVIAWILWRVRNGKI